MNVSEFEADRDIKSYLPPITPAGMFKLDFHFHEENNITLIDVEALLEICHIGLSDYISLG